VGRKSSGDTEADEAAATLPRGRPGDRCELSSPASVHDQHAGAGGDLGFEIHSHEGDDGVVLDFCPKVSISTFGFDVA